MDQAMTIAQGIEQLKKRIAEEETKSLRPPGSVKLIAVSKGQASEKIKEAYQCGLREFAENYLQEAEEKMRRLNDLDICWHFIGPIQSNKAKDIARQFSWVHSVSRLKIAQLLDQHRPKDAQALNICLQINLSGEESKSGMSMDESFKIIETIKSLKHLNCRGLMTIPPEHFDAPAQYVLFCQLKELLHQLNQYANLQMDTLSMGMSNDLGQAIHAGSTMVRIGRALFGERQ